MEMMTGDWRLGKERNHFSVYIIVIIMTHWSYVLLNDKKKKILFLFNK